MYWLRESSAPIMEALLVSKLSRDCWIALFDPKMKEKLMTHRSYLSHGKQFPLLGHSWAPWGPRNAPSCLENQRRSSSLPMYTVTECDLNSNTTRYFTRHTLCQWHSFSLWLSTWVQKDAWMDETVSVPVCPLRACRPCPLWQSVVYMLQSPAPALIKIAPPLSGPSMKARSLMVPSCMLNSRSGPKAQKWQCSWDADNNRSLLSHCLRIYALTPTNKTLIMHYCRVY